MAFLDDVVISTSTVLSDHTGILHPFSILGLDADAPRFLDLNEMLPELNERPSESVAVNLARYEPLRQRDVSNETVPVEVAPDVETLTLEEHELVLMRMHQLVIEFAPG